MAKSSKTPGKTAKGEAGVRRPLVIVESPAKAKTISRFLGRDYAIEASIGHVRDLPSSAAEIPPHARDKKWARLGIDIEQDFEPLYVVPHAKQAQLRKLKALLEHADTLYLATDEDREGESISWHLQQVLRPKVPVKRLAFHEITKEAIEEALRHPREIDSDLVEAQEARRIVDRLYGYSVSPLLWRKIRPRLSAGRVQSVAVRLVVERERERLRFRRAAYWDVRGTFGAALGGFDAMLVEVGERRVATGKDFDAGTGELGAAPAAAGVVRLDEAAAAALVRRLGGRPARVASLEEKPFRDRPSAPYTTSTLTQEAARRLRFSASRTMRAAQRLFETGFITYHRTDSTTLSDEALEGARAAIEAEFGGGAVVPGGRQYATKVRNAQEAHEAIRPAGARFRHPRDVSELGEDERRVYELVWRRTVASQMPDAVGRKTTVRVRAEDAVFQATGKVIDDPGYRRAYVEDDAEDTEAAARETDLVLPAMQEGQVLEPRAYEALGHETQPPPRLTEAGLIKELEARGIGRPSTYASIIETILARDYCFKRGTALVPTFTAFAVIQLLDANPLRYLVDYDFTARMEEELDEISNGRQKRRDYLTSFWKGNGKPGLSQQLAKADKATSPQEVCLVRDVRLREGMEVRVGRYGPFLTDGEKRVTLPDEIPPDELTQERADELIEKGGNGARHLGPDPATGLEVLVKVGRFGPYVQLGTGTEAPKPEPAPAAAPKKGKGARGKPRAQKPQKPRMASLLRGMSPETITLEEALALLALPRALGEAVPEGGTAPEQVAARNGRFGPYLSWGTETRSIPAGESPLTIGLERALEILRSPRPARGARGGARAAAKVLKSLGAHPQSGAEVRVLDGRYGPYVTDGATNANVPKDRAPDALTLAEAVELLAARAARGPARRPRRRR